MRKRKTIFLAVSVLFLFSACMPKINYTTKKEAFPNMYEERPLSILVLPPVNMTTAADAKEYYATTIAEPLSFVGYYIFPIEVTTDILKYEGLYDTELSEGIPPEKFKQFFGADAVMYIKIMRWNTAYYVVGGHVTVAVDCLLKSTTTGRSLWNYNGFVTVDTSGGSNSGGGLGGLIAKVIVTAISTATTDYVPIAKRANFITMSSMPYGKYHPNFNNDRDFKIISKEQPGTGTQQLSGDANKK